MSQRPLGVALVGAGGGGRWGTKAHIPALQATPGLALKWLATGRPETAEAVGREYDLPATHELDRILADPAVDVVSVVVRVRKHAELARAALAAGKHVYCEWPLAVSLAEARDLARFADEHRLLHAVGMQGRYAPGLAAAAQLLESGSVGRIIGFNLRMFSPVGMIARPMHRAHLRHADAAGHVLTVQGGHALDMLQVLVGPLAPAAARLWSAMPEFQVEETGETLPRDAPDNLVVMLDGNGISGTAHVSQTASRQQFVIEILCSRGLVQVSGVGQAESCAISVSVTDVAGKEPRPVEIALPPAPGGTLKPGDAAYNVALAYRNFERCLRLGQADATLPTFHAAVAQHAFLEAIVEVSRAAGGSGRGA